MRPRPGRPRALYTARPDGPRAGQRSYRLLADILAGYVTSGGTVIVSSHSMDLVQRMCDHVAIIAAGRVLISGTVDEVRGDSTLEDRFVDLVGGRHTGEGPEWLRVS